MGSTQATKRGKEKLSGKLHSLGGLEDRVEDISQEAEKNKTKTRRK